MELYTEFGKLQVEDGAGDEDWGLKIDGGPSGNGVFGFGDRQSFTL